MPHYHYALKEIEKQITLDKRERWRFCKMTDQAEYERVLACFAQTRDDSSQAAWRERLNAFAQLHPYAPPSVLDMRAIVFLTEIEEIFSELELSQINTEVYRAGLGSGVYGAHYEERIFGTEAGNFPILLRTFLELAHRVMYEGERWEETLDSTTHLLHFMCPALFPVFTSDICEMIYHSSQMGYYRYHGYVFALHDFLRDFAAGQALVEEARKQGLSAVRLAGLILSAAEEKV